MAPAVGNTASARVGLRLDPFWSIGMQRAPQGALSFCAPRGMSRNHPGFAPGPCPGPSAQRRPAVSPRDAWSIPTSTAARGERMVRPYMSLACRDFGGVLTSATRGLMRGDKMPIPLSRPAGVRSPPSWKSETVLLRRGASKPSGLAVGNPGSVGTKGRFSRASGPPAPRFRNPAPFAAGTQVETINAPINRTTKAGVRYMPISTNVAA